MKIVFSLFLMRFEIFWWFWLEKVSASEMRNSTHIENSLKLWNNWLFADSGSGFFYSLQIQFLSSLKIIQKTTKWNFFLDIITHHEKKFRRSEKQYFDASFQFKTEGEYKNINMSDFFLTSMCISDDGNVTQTQLLAAQNTSVKNINILLFIFIFWDIFKSFDQ